MQTAIQLYTLRDLDEPLADTVARVAAAGLDGVEFAGLDDSPVGEALQAGGLEAPAAHVSPASLGVEQAAGGLETDQATARGTAAEYRALGVERLVVPMLEPSVFDDVDDSLAGALDGLADALDCRLCYHNHEFEFAAVDTDPDNDHHDQDHHDQDHHDQNHHDQNHHDAAKTPWGRLVAATSSLAFELDVGWVHAAGLDPVRVLETYGDRIPLVHLKDVVVDATAPRGARPVDLGEGDVDLAGGVAAARAADVEWLVVEHDDPVDPLATLAGARETVAGLSRDGSVPR